VNRKERRRLEHERRTASVSSNQAAPAEGQQSMAEPTAPKADTPSAAMVKSAAQPVEVADELGRIIRIRKLNALDRMRLLEAIGSSGAEIPQYVGYAVLAASVIAINGTLESPPRTKKDIEFLVQRLDDAGLNAVAKAYQEHFGVTAEEDDREQIKN